MKSNHQEDNLGKTTRLGAITNYYHQSITLVVDWCMTHVTKCIRVTPLCRIPRSDALFFLTKGKMSQKQTKKSRVFSTPSCILLASWHSTTLSLENK